jgi:hypothetical protein
MGFIFQCFTIVTVILAMYVAVFHFRDEVVFEKGNLRLCNTLSKVGQGAWSFFILPSIAICDDMVTLVWFNLELAYDCGPDEENDNEGGEPAVS